jgi:hypothetical protein
LADDKAKTKAILRWIVDATEVTDIDIHHIRFVFDLLVNIVDPNAVYVIEKRARAAANAAKTSTPAVATATPARSTIDFSADVLLVNVKHQATPPTPGTTGTLKPHKL